MFYYVFGRWRSSFCWTFTNSFLQVNFGSGSRSLRRLGSDRRPFGATADLVLYSMHGAYDDVIYDDVWCLWYLIWSDWSLNMVVSQNVDLWWCWEPHYSCCGFYQFKPSAVCPRYLALMHSQGWVETACARWSLHKPKLMFGSQRMVGDVVVTAQWQWQHSSGLVIHLNPGTFQYLPNLFSQNPDVGIFMYFPSWRPISNAADLKQVQEHNLAQMRTFATWQHSASCVACGLDMFPCQIYDNYMILSLNNLQHYLCRHNSQISIHSLGWIVPVSGGSEPLEKGGASGHCATGEV